MREACDWERVRYFKKREFTCSHSGRCDMDMEFMEFMDELREKFGKPLIITSGFRALSHPAEAKKPEGRRGAHTLGLAADIRAAGDAPVILTAIARDIARGRPLGVGWSQRGEWGGGSSTLI